MRKNVVLILVAGLFFIGAFLGIQDSSLAASSVTAKAGDQVKILTKTTGYEKPSYSSKKLGSVAKDRVLTVISQPIKEALYVQNEKGVKFYVTSSADVVTVIPKNDKPSTTQSYVTAQKGNQVKILTKTTGYEKASYSSKQLGSVAKGRVLTVISQPIKEALYVQNEKGVKFYITASADVVAVQSGPTKPEQPNGQKPAWEVKADQIITYTEQFLGVPYGPGNIDTTGNFNCSTLTRYVYVKHGINVPSGGARGQSQYGKEVSRNQLRKGDLVFFKTPTTINAGYVGLKEIGHVGIYAGKDKNGNELVLHTYGTEYGVTYSKMDKGTWWDKVFVKGMRVIND